MLMETTTESNLKWLASQLGLRYVASEIDNALALLAPDVAPAKDMLICKHPKLAVYNMVFLLFNFATKTPCLI